MVQSKNFVYKISTFKGTVLQVFLLLVCFMNQIPPSPRVSHLDGFKFFRKFSEIFTSQGAPPVSTTPTANLPPVLSTLAANFSTSFTSVVDTGGKFATSVNDTGGNQGEQYQAADTLK
jgi:hypothetical protein